MYARLCVMLLLLLPGCGGSDRGRGVYLISDDFRIIINVREIFAVFRVKKAQYLYNANNCITQ